MNSYICRCGTHLRIIRAIQRVVKFKRESLTKESRTWKQNPSPAEIFLRARASSSWASASSATAAKVLAQGDGLSVDGMDPTVLDSWMAISKDGTVTVFTGKVELGTGVVTALAQIVAEELDVPFNKVYMDSGDTDKAVDQGVTAAARTVERGGVQLRQASAAARQELLKLASAHLDTPVDMLTVTDGVVSVIGNPAKKIAYGDLLGGKRFNIKIVAAGVSAGT